MKYAIVTERTTFPPSGFRCYACRVVLWREFWRGLKWDWTHYPWERRPRDFDALWAEHNAVISGMR